MSNIKWKSVVCWILAVVVIAGVIYTNIQNQKSLQNTGKKNVYAVLPLTGMYASAGKEMKELLSVYMTEKEKSNIHIIQIDSQCNATKAVTAVQQAILDENNPIILTSETATVNGLMPILQKKDGFMLIFGGIAYPKKYNNFQRVTYSANDAVIPQIQYMKRHNLNDAVLMYSFNDYGDMVARAFKSEYTRLGGKILEEYSFVPSDPDIRVMVLKALSHDPSAIFIGSVYCLALQNIVRELRAQGYKGTILADPLFSQPYFLKQLGNNANNTIFLYPDYSYNTNSLANRVISRFIQKHGTEPSVYAVSLLDAVQAVDEIALKSWDISQDTFVNKLKQINGAKFIDSGNAEYHFKLSTFKDGKIVPVEEMEDR